MKPVRIKIGDLIGPHCVMAEDGQKLYDKIMHHLNNGQDVVLDFEFEGGLIFASSFLNTGIGQLLSQFSSEILKERVKFINVNPYAVNTIKMVIDNAKDYYEKRRRE